MGYNKLTFRLKQHTPLIHFQHHQEGATLRATELKPKLDRFILEKLGDGDTAKGVSMARNREWIISEHPALAYKVMLYTPDVKIQKIEKGQRIPMYFGNIARDYDMSPRFYSFSRSSVTVRFFSQNNDIIDLIRKFFPAFIAVTNFGTRQNKGFGTFWVDGYAPNELLNNTSYLQIKKNQIRDFNDILNVINYYYQRLKSGINYSYLNKRTHMNFTHYKHSFLKLYLSKNEDYQWEKRWIKEKFLGLESSDVAKKFARSMLGLADSYTYKSPRHKRPDQVYPKYDLEIRVNHWLGKEEEEQENIKKKKITRFKSPITFKPLEFDNEWRIYIISSEIPEQLEDQTFRFESDDKSHDLKTPAKRIIISKLLESYNDHLGKKFKAYTYSGKYYDVEIAF